MHKDISSKIIYFVCSNNYKSFSLIRCTVNSAIVNLHSHFVWQLYSNKKKLEVTPLTAMCTFNLEGQKFNNPYCLHRPQLPIMLLALFHIFVKLVCILHTPAVNIMLHMWVMIWQAQLCKCYNHFTFNYGNNHFLTLCGTKNFSNWFHGYNVTSIMGKRALRQILENQDFSVFWRNYILITVRGNSCFLCKLNIELQHFECIRYGHCK